METPVPMLDASLRIDYRVSSSGRELHQGAGFFCLDSEVRISNLFSGKSQR